MLYQSPSSSKKEYVTVTTPKSNFHLSPNHYATIRKFVHQPPRTKETKNPNSQKL
jgi:hypothetical protein